MGECAGCPGGCAPAERPWSAPRRSVPLSGLIVVDKPAGMTSHDVVDTVRRAAGQRKVGHAGTLDPMATGVLLVCLGQGTRVAEYLALGHKRYRAGILLGAATDTYDADGQITSAGGHTDFSPEELESALARFRGRIRQIPPAFSAVKQDGEPLYRRARRGEPVEPRPRWVELFEVALLDWTPPLLTLEVECSPGTYIRSLAHDLGQALGCGGHLAALARLRSGAFSLEAAVSLRRLEEAFRHGQEAAYLLPVDEALLDWPALILSAEEAQRIAHGQPLAADLAGSDGARCRAYDAAGEFVAILAFDPPSGLWRPDKVFAPAGD